MEHNLEEYRSYESDELNQVTVETRNEDGILTTEVTIYFEDGSFEVHSYIKE